MKYIYLLHEHGGEYEDAHDNIIGAYSDYSVAVKKGKELNEENKRDIEQSNIAYGVANGNVALESSGLTQEEVDDYTETLDTDRTYQLDDLLNHPVEDR